jgi:hypothetical protein
MFERSRLLLEQYYCALLSKGIISLRAEHLLHELRGRLRTLQWLHARLIDLDQKIEAQARAELPLGQSETAVRICVFSDHGRPHCEDHREGQLPFSDADELRALLEAFYYCGFRIRDILRDGRKELGGLGAFEAVGVRNVRNHLVEHPDGVSGVIVSSFSAGGPVGPRIRPIRWSLDPPGTNDPGLHANATEFNAALESLLEAAIQKCLTHAMKPTGAATK